MLKTYPKGVSAIIVSYMTGAVLIDCLKAALTDPAIDEIILIDNGNTPDIRMQISVVAADSHMRILQGQGNIGFARACNYGARFARNTYLLFLNPDAILQKNGVAPLVETGAGLKTPWIAGGLLRGLDGKEQRGARRAALTPISAWVSFTPLHKLPFLRSLHKDGEALPDRPVPMPVISGAFLMTDKVSFHQLGGFDEGYFLHVEDIDLCRRADLLGGDVYFVPGADVIHHGSTSHVPRQFVEWQKCKGFIRYFWRYSPRIWAKGLAVLAVPMIIIAIMGRAWWQITRGAFLRR